MKQNPKPEPFIKTGTVTDYKIDGDKATARNNAETMNFVRIGGRCRSRAEARAAAT